MAQTNVQIRTNGVKVFDCLEAALKEIKPANGFITDGVTVDRKRDPRKQRENDPGQGVAATGTLVRLYRYDAKRSMALVGDSRRKHRMLALSCHQQLTRDQDRAGITGDQVQDWLEKDIDNLIARDKDLLGAAAICNAQTGPWGDVGTFGGPPCAIDLAIADIQALPDTGVQFPVLHQVIILEYWEDLHGPNGEPGHI